jgi:hypothetical protein
MLAVFARFETDVRQGREAEGIARAKRASAYTGGKPPSATGVTTRAPHGDRRQRNRRSFLASLVVLGRSMPAQLVAVQSWSFPILGLVIAGKPEMGVGVKAAQSLESGAIGHTRWPGKLEQRDPSSRRSSPSTPATWDCICPVGRRRPDA